MVNALVLHKKHLSWGIGCISKELSKSYRVNFGLDSVKTCAKDAVTVIDTSECKTITLQEYSSRILSDKSTLSHCIVGNEVRHFVGIGWITIKVVSLEDLNKYPRVA